MKNKLLIGHLITLITMTIWGTTYISTKILLQNFDPVAILFYRFFFAYIILLLLYPKFKKVNNLKEELLFLSAGISGVTLYYLIENIALEYTLASNVGLFIATAPILTAILSNIFLKDEPFSKNLIYGFIISMLGVFIVIFNGSFILKLNPLGDCLAILAAFVWAIYSVILKKIGNKHNYIYTTRKIFFYGILFLVPLLFTVNLNFKNILIPSMLYNLLFLSLIASGLCFIMWNTGVNYIGAIKASNYIYIVPFITASASIIVLKEKITSIVIIGAFLIIVGLYISQNGLKNPFKYFTLFIEKIKRRTVYEHK